MIGKKRQAFDIYYDRRRFLDTTQQQQKDINGFGDSKEYTMCGTVITKIFFFF
jgi:hypothetical protein